MAEMANYTLLTRPEYFKTLAKQIKAAKRGERVLIATMHFDITEPLVADIAEALTAAARRGCHVTLLVDAINFLMDHRGIPGPLLVRHSITHLSGEYSQIHSMLERLHAAGGTYRITNMPKHRLRLPVTGRSHLKGAVIGDWVFIGGCNLNRPEQLDVMVSWQDKHTADTLEDWFNRIAESGQVREAFSDVDVEAKIDNSSRFLLDAGVPGQSLIYDEALRLIDDAKEWIYITCQYFPGGVTAQRLAAAQARGVRVEIDYSHPRSHGTAAAMQRLHQISQRARRLPRNFFTRQLGKTVPKLHAKVLASEREALIGSHNYISQGVRFGTAEIALHTTNKLLIAHVCSFVQKQLSAVRPDTRPTKTAAKGN